MAIMDEAEKLVEKIGESIKNYFNEYPLDKIYTYEFQADTELFNNEEIKRIEKFSNWFKKNIYLKSILSEKIDAEENKSKYYDWIVKIWGGIKKFDKTIEEIDEFKNDIEKEILNAKKFSTISSYSKIVSFINPQKYFILDSKVAYTLNWLLIKNYSKENSYFPVLKGQNSDLVKYNIDTIINLYEKSNPKKYYKKSEAYFIYCEFVRKLYNKLKSNYIKEPYYIEMMLFGLFEKIIEEIKAKVQISIEK